MAIIPKVFPSVPVAVERFGSEVVKDLAEGGEISIRVRGDGMPVVGHDDDSVNLDVGFAGRPSEAKAKLSI